MTETAPAQIAFVDQTFNTFSIVAPHETLSGQFALWLMPDPGCPVADITQTPKTNVGEICKEFITPAGVNDVPALIEALEKAGAVIGTYEDLVVKAGLNNQATSIPIQLPYPVMSGKSKEQLLKELGF